MALFTLMNKQNVDLAPGKKLIAAKDFSTILDSKNLLDQLAEDAKQYKESVVKEMELLSQTAQNAGFEEGLKKWAQQVSYLEEQTKKVKAELEAMIVPAAMTAAKRIVAREMENDPAVIVDIVRQALKSVAHNKLITIYVCKSDMQQLEAQKSKLKEGMEKLENLTLRERDSIPPGDCVIETEEGIVTVQLEKQWQALEAALKNLL
ncbi:MAG: HrpE/YscL family type III secretion apparatus protein [Parachlamydiales bacterium]|nr:HrpE/YscL family type III secretion apparatus protein [Parachlamydiales bacterium]